jgi:DNA-binding transcriptional MerR regulator
MPPDAPYAIADLARLTGLSVRTIRYYLAQGLLPASGESGPGAHYGEGHLGRLRLVRRLQQQHLPLAEIRARLAALSDTEVVSLVTAQDTTALAEPETSALDYVRSVLAGSGPAPSASPVAAMAQAQPQPQTPALAPSAPPAPPAQRAAGMPRMRDEPAAPPSVLRRMRLPFLSEAGAAIPSVPSVPTDLEASAPAVTAAPASAPESPDEPAPQSIERSQWERLSLGPNLELHVRRPLGRLEQKRVERLITIARQVLKEEQP